MSSITGLVNVTANDIICDTIETSTVSNNMLNTLVGINTGTTIQQQINNITGLTGFIGQTGPTGPNSIGATGGFKCID